MDQSKYKILLVDDEEDIVEFLSYNLIKEGFNVITAHDGIEAIRIAKKESPDLIIMDVMMPRMDGMTAVQEIRKIPAFAETIIVFLTARAEDYSQIAGFEVGADDYVSKPVKPKVLMSRVNALLRRASKKENPNTAIEAGDLVIDPERFIVIKEGAELTLPNKEFKILALLAGSPNKVYSREDIFAKVWGNDVVVGDRTIDVHVRKIREKIGLDNIKTIKGVGYKFSI